jgi:hypothetical protein
MDRDQFVPVATAFLDKFQPLLTKSREELSEAVESFQQLVQFYPSGLAKPEPQDYFAIVAKFLVLFQVGKER